MVDIAASVDATFPKTAVLLAADTEVGYATKRSMAIERAKVDLYENLPVPAEASIPAVAAYWIVDRAVIILIPVAIDYYSNQYRLSDGIDKENITYYDRVAALERLRDELQSKCNADKEKAVNAISPSGNRPGQYGIPEVDYGGMLDPTDRAFRRGPLP